MSTPATISGLWAQTDNAADNQEAKSDPRDLDKSFVVSGAVYDFDMGSGAKNVELKLYSYRGLNKGGLTLVTVSNTDDKGRFRIDSIATPYGHRFNRLNYMLVIHSKGRSGGAVPVYAMNAQKLNHFGIKTAKGNTKGKIVDQTKNSDSD